MFQEMDTEVDHHTEQLPQHTIKIDKRVQIHIENNVINSIKTITVYELLNSSAKTFNQRPALGFQDSEKNWHTINYHEYEEKVKKIAKIFIHLGFKERDSIGILAFNCPEWFYTALAAIYAGGIVLGIYITNSAESVQYVLETSGSTICIVDNKKQMDKIRSIKSTLPKLKTVIQINEPFDSIIDQEDGYYKWRDIENIPIDNEYEIELEKRLNALVSNNCCSLIYTSGTTGRPKGVMLSHDNIIFSVKSIMKRLHDIKMGEEIFVSYLPLSHLAAQYMDLFTSICFGGCVYFADSDALKGTLIGTLLKVRPTRFVGVPRVWEKIYDKLIKIEGNAGYISRLLLNVAKTMVYNYHIAEMNGDGDNSRITYKIAQKITNKVKCGLGLDRCRTFLTGAAPTNVVTKRYFASIDILLCEIYGLSETGPIGFDPKLRNFDAVGRPLDGFEIRINNQDEKGVGEIFIKGRSIFMGYLNELKKNEETFQGEWYKTGDLGRIDINNDLYIVGRVKELIITSGGENVSFIFIEETIKNELPCINNAFVVGDKKKFLTILLTIKTEIDPETGCPLDKLQYESLQWMESLELNYTKLSEILVAGPCPIVLKSIQDGIDRYNKKAISNVQTIKKFALLPHDFSMTTDELGPTLKLKRNVVNEKYKNIIDQFYE